MSESPSPEVEAARPEPAGATEPRPVALQQEWSAHRTLTGRQLAVLAALGVVAIAIAIWSPLILGQILIGVSLAVFLIATSVRSAYAIKGLRTQVAKPEPLAEAALPSYTVVVALYHEAEVAAKLCASLSRLDYPEDRLQVILACEEPDRETVAACREHALDDWLVLEVPRGIPQTKPRALNRALAHASGELLTIFDAEDRPEPDQLKLAAAAFAAGPDELASVQARLDVVNERENLLTSCFATEYVTLFDCVLPGIAAYGNAVPLGGTSTHFRTRAIREVGAWDAWNVTEDCELGMRLCAAGYTTEVLDSVTWEEGVSNLPAWVRQRSRWVKGYAQTALVMLRTPVRTARAMGTRNYLASLLTVGSVPLVLMLQVPAWAFISVHLWDILRTGKSLRLLPLFPEVLNSFALIAFVTGTLFVVFVHALAVHRRGRPRLVKFALLMPAYLLLGSIAAWKGCLQLLWRPHYWDKTQHVLTDGGEAISGGTGVVGAASPAGRSGLNGSSGGNNGSTANPQRRAYELGHLRSDPWLQGVLAVSVAALVWAAWYFRHLRLSFWDSPSHLIIARRVFDNLSPGVDQLGVHWPPLFQTLEIPFAQFDYLYYSGLAGTIAASIAALGAVYFVFRLAKACEAPSMAAAAASIAFLAQPELLFSATVPMHYTTMMVTGLAAIAFLVEWLRFDRPRSLVWCAVALMLGILTHFDPWFLAILIFGVVAVVAVKRRKRVGLESDLLLWMIIAGSGLAIWLGMNVWWTGKWNSFLSVCAQCGEPIAESHKGLSSLLDYPRAVVLVAGVPLTVAAVIGVAVVIWQGRQRRYLYALLLILYPFFQFAFLSVTVGSLILVSHKLKYTANIRYAITAEATIGLLLIIPQRRRIFAVAAAALVIAAGVIPALNRGGPATSLTYDVRPQDAAAVRTAGDWLHANAKSGRIFIPAHSYLQDRLEVLSRLHSDRFVEDNDSFAGINAIDTSIQSKVLKEANVKWIVKIDTLQGNVGVDWPSNLPPAGSTVCATYRGTRNRVLITIWSTGSCPAPPVHY